MVIKQLIEEIDKLPPDDLEAVYRHVAMRRQKAYWLVGGETFQPLKTILASVHEQAADLSDDEIDAAIDEALANVRRER